MEGCPRPGLLGAATAPGAGPLSRPQEHRAAAGAPPPPGQTGRASSAECGDIVSGVWEKGPRSGPRLQAREEIAPREKEWYQVRRAGLGRPSGKKGKARDTFLILFLIQ